MTRAAGGIDFEALVLASMDVIAVIDTDTRLIYANPAAERVLGLTAGAEIGQLMSERLHPEDLAIVVERLDTITMGCPSGVPISVRIKDAAGEWRNFQVVGSSRLDDPTVAGIVVNARDITDQSKTVRAVRALSQANQLLIHATDEASLLTDMCRAIVGTGEYLLAWVGYAEDDAAQTVRPVAAAGATCYLDGLELTWGDRPTGCGATGTAIREGVAEIIPDVRACPSFARWRDQADRFGIRSSCALPFRVDDTAAALCIYDTEPGAFAAAEVELFTQLAGNLAFGIERLRDVTRLASHQAELERSERFLTAITDNMAEGLMATDAAGNVTYVNAAAARLLDWAAEDMIGQPAHATFHYLRPDGGPYPMQDCPILDLAPPQQVLRVERDEFVRRDGTPIPVTYSASAVTTQDDFGVVIVFADVSERVAEQDRIERELEELSWIGRVRDALADNRFTLFAQPIHDLSTLRPVEYELLLRMIGPGGETIPPGRFLPVAERYGLSSDIDRWVIAEAVRIAGLGHTVAFNLSARSVSDPAMLSFIRHAVQDAGLPAGRLICEITETAMMQDSAAALSLVEGLNDLGCAVALDDFGMGYSGFAQLKRLPVTYLKIDQEFVRDLVHQEASRHVVSAVVSLARAFQMITIAEGAEDDATVELLESLGVDRIQGFVIAKPAPAEEVLREASECMRRPRALSPGASRGSR